MMPICDKIKELRKKYNKQIYIMLVVFIFIIAITARIWNWPNAINDINCDEAMSAINAKSIAENGTDIYGTKYPIYFEAWLFSGQSAFAIYSMALFIKILGFSTISVRLPIMLITILSLIFMFLLINKMFKNKKITLITLFLLAINPWDIMQSHWCLDCNFYPHIMLIAVYFLYVGIEGKKNIALYFSMFLFALTLYTYGIALYLTPIFLLIIAIYLLKKKRINVKELMLCILIFLIISLPIIMMCIINLFNLPTVNIGGLTIQNFNYATRKDDMFIFSENKIYTLLNNIDRLKDILIYQKDGLIWNALPKYGTIYLISLPIIIIGLINIFYKKFYKKIEDERNQFGIIIILAWLFIGIICGILINNININRMNIIWYAFIMINGIGIYEIIQEIKYKKILTYIILTIYTISFIGFINSYYSTESKKIANSFTWSKGLIDAIQYVENKNASKVVLSNGVCDIDKKDIFIRYATKGEQKDKYISKQEFLKFYDIQEVANMDYSTTNTEYIIQTIEKDVDLTEPIYIINKEEEDKLTNIHGYEKTCFNDYIVLMEE